ncbi:cysteine peptidase family C39 domain-containing protein, partial [Xylophilus ampelinus]
MAAINQLQNELQKLIPVMIKGSQANRSLASLCTVARIHQIAADPATLAHQMGFLPSGELSSSDMLRA